METKGITCKIPLDLHNRISEEIRETETVQTQRSPLTRYHAITENPDQITLS